VGQTGIGALAQAKQRVPGQCPYCRGSSTFAFSAKDWNQRTSRRQFKYLLCSKCSLIFIEPQPDDLAPFYVNEQYDVPADLRALESRADSQAWKVEILKSLVSGGSLFEVGPATGEFAFAARAAGYRPKLAEMDRNCCDFLRNALHLDVVQTSRPAECLGSGHKYDAICLWQAIEHIPDFWELLANAADSLSAHGVIVLSTPNPRSLQARFLGRYWPHIDAPRHLYLISQTWFRAFAARYNLSIVMNTTKDVGSTGLNYYGWCLAVRNLSHNMLSESHTQSIAARITKKVRRWEEVEGRGCSYTIAFRKKPSYEAGT
jgi:2-polyprenyl-3-methyl-5-hydroxy-6-metoxy-1,4-benzoquinol methylase